MRRLAHLVVRRPWLVIAFWIVLVIVSVPNMQKATDSLSKKFTVPGREGFQTNEKVLRGYRIDLKSDAVVPVVTVQAPAKVTDPAVRAELGAALEKAQAAVPGSRLLSYANTGDTGFVSADGRTTYALLLLAPTPDGGFDQGVNEVKDARAALASATVGGGKFHVTGQTALENSGGGGGASVLTEALLGGVGALLVLIVVFASFLAIVPVLMAVFAIVTTFMLVWAITPFAEVSFIVEFLIALIGLGVAIDYTLLVVMRWREERAKGTENRQAVIDAMATAGSAVVFSGTTVGIGLLALIALPVPFLRSVGYAGVLIPLVSVVVAITLLPAILATVGPRLDWPRRRKEKDASRFWMKWSALIVRRRWLAAAAGIAILAALALPTLGINIGNPSPESLAKKGDARDGLVALKSSGIGSGVLTPFVALAPAASAAAVTAAIAKVPGVHAALATGSAPGFADTAGGTALVPVIPDRQANGSWGRALDSRLKKAVRSADPAARVGGQAAQSADFVSAVYGSFPLMLGLVVILTLILLMRAFRSVLLPIKAVLLNLVSVAGALGILVLVWQHGWGSHLIWGITGTGAITEFIPLMVFAFLYGLSMDYEVFILTRVREEYDEGGSTDNAVIQGVGRTGRLVTSAALILFLAFAALGSAGETTIKIFATGLGAGIILDATVVRMLLVPALVSLFGELNWWLPAPLAKLLRVHESHAHPGTSA